MQPQHMLTYSLKAPMKTHRRRVASCEEFGDCINYQNGFEVQLDLATTEGQFHAETIRNLRGYQYTVEKRGELTTYTFPAGQNCFGQHTVPIEREPFYLVRGTGGTRTHTNGADWVDDLQENLDGLRTIADRG